MNNLERKTEDSRNVGAKYVIIGHSENRANGDNDYKISLKIKSALKKKLKVIFVRHKQGTALLFLKSKIGG